MRTGQKREGALTPCAGMSAPSFSKVIIRLPPLLSTGLGPGELSGARRQPKRLQHVRHHLQSRNGLPRVTRRPRLVDLHRDYHLSPKGLVCLKGSHDLADWRKQCCYFQERNLSVTLSVQA